MAGEVSARDLAVFPRSVENIPRWLQRELDPHTSLPRVPAVGYSGQAKYVKWLSDQLKQALPPGWNYVQNYVQVQFREVGGHTETNAIVQNVAGVMAPWTPPLQVGERFHELRAAMRGSGRGPWYSATFEMRFNDEEKLSTNRSDEPQWIAPPPHEAYQNELRLGDSPARLPEWLLARL